MVKTVFDLKREKPKKNWGFSSVFAFKLAKEQKNCPNFLRPCDK